MDSNKYADSHCHLNYPGLKENQSAVVERMKDAGLVYALNVCTKLEEFADIMKLNAEKEMSKWVKSFPSVKPLFKLLEKSAQDEILNTAGNHQVDLLVMGSKGQTKMSLALLGSNTMKVVKANDSIPLLIVKKEGENLDFIDALKKV